MLLRRSAPIELADPARLLAVIDQRRPPHLGIGSFELSVEPLPLTLRHPWTLSRNTSHAKKNVLITLTRDGITGRGEAAPNVRYGQSWQTTRSALMACRPLLTNVDPFDLGQLAQKLDQALRGHPDARAAIDMALFDWIGKALKLPLHAVLGVRDRQPLTSYTIGIDSPEKIREKIEEAHEFPLLKIKLGTERDQEILSAVRAVTDKPLMVDANEGWTDRKAALKHIQWLQGEGVILVEQPMPAGSENDVRWLREKIDMPLYADESSCHIGHIPRVVGAYDGINVKLMKCGGIFEALKMIALAHSLELGVMLGCMIESSLGITAAAQLSPFVDHVDLDGHLLLAEDPFRGVHIVEGRLHLPAHAGLGVIPA